MQRASDGASPTVNLTYDPLGRLWQVSGSGVTTTFLQDGGSVVAEYTGSTLTGRFVHGTGVDEPLVWYQWNAGTSSFDRRFLHADERGSIVAVTNDSGTVTNINAYDEYGIPGSGNAGRFEYTGQLWLGELGMQYSRARIYSPTLGRFLQTDPIGMAGGINLYAYVGNDPVNFSDPSGLSGSHALVIGRSIWQTMALQNATLNRIGIQQWLNGGRSTSDTDLEQHVEVTGTRLQRPSPPRTPIVILASAQAGNTPQERRRRELVRRERERRARGAACGRAVLDSTAEGFAAGGGLSILGDSMFGRVITWKVTLVNAGLGAAYNFYRTLNTHPDCQD